MCDSADDGAPSGSGPFLAVDPFKRNVNMKHGIVFAALLLSSTLGWRAADAHTIVVEKDVAPGSQLITLRISHGCSGAATTALSVKIPAGVTQVTPAYVPGWAVAVKERKLDPPIKGWDGAMLSETVDEVTWTGGPIPDHLFADFKLKVEFPNDSGKTFYFKTIQKCGSTEMRWIETPKQGEKDFDFSDPTNPVAKYKTPSPFIRVIELPALGTTRR